MSCAGRQDSYVACFQFQSATAISAELHGSLTAGDAEHLVDTGMVVNVVVNAISPGIAPAVTFKQFFKHGRRIEVVRKPDCAAINDKRPLRMVGDDPIILETESAGLAFADQAAERARLTAATSR